MHFMRKVAMMMAVLLMAASLFVTTAYAAEVETDGEESLWDKIQSAGSEAAGYVKEHGPGWVESAKDGAAKAADKAGELIDAAKEKAPEVIDTAKDKVSEAQQQFSDWNAGQQDEFFDWFENQTGANASEPAVTPAPEASSNTSANAAPEQPPTAQEPTVPPEVWEPSTESSTMPETQEKPDESSGDDATTTEPDESSNTLAIILAAAAVALIVGVVSSLTVLHMRDTVSKRRHSGDHHFDEHHY